MRNGPKSRPPAVALVVDDDPVPRSVLARIVAAEGFEVVEAEDGEEAVRLALSKRPAVVLLDLLMPRKDGFEALKEIRAGAPGVMVVVVSSVDDPREVERAIGLGAVNFVSKPFDSAEVHGVMERVRAAHAEEADVLPCVRVLDRSRTALDVANDLGLLGRVVAFLGHELSIRFPGRELPLVETKLALYEAIANAIEHGNLEIDYDAKTAALATEGGIAAVIERRRREPPWRDRVVRVSAEYGPSSVTYLVRDAGPGFPHGDDAHRRRLGDAHSLHGRGLLLIRHYMTHVGWNAAGNEIRMELDLGSAPAGSGAHRQAGTG